MADAPPPHQQPGSVGEEKWPAPSWRKIAEFVTGVFQLQRSVEQLKRDNERLREEVSRLQRIVDDHTGQLKVMMTLMETAVNERAVRAGENAALRLVEQMLMLRDIDKTRED